MTFKAGNRRARRSLWRVSVLFALVPLLDFWAQQGPPYPWGVPLLTAAVTFTASFLTFKALSAGRSQRLIWQTIIPLVIAATAAIGYLALASVFTAERINSNGESERVVLGYTIRPDVELAIQAAKEKQESEGELLSARLGRTEGQIRQDTINQEIRTSGNPAAPYTKQSRAVIAAALLALWELSFAAAAAGLGTLLLSAVRR